MRKLDNSPIRISLSYPQPSGAEVTAMHRVLGIQAQVFVLVEQELLPAEQFLQSLAKTFFEKKKKQDLFLSGLCMCT